MGAARLLAHPSICDATGSQVKTIRRMPHTSVSQERTRNAWAQVRRDDPGLSQIQDTWGIYARARLARNVLTVAYDGQGVRWGARGQMSSLTLDTEWSSCGKRNFGLVV